MSNEITSTDEIAEAEWNGDGEPNDVRSDIVATKDPEHRGMEFHVSLRDYTLRDMEDLIVEAAARQIVGQRSDTAMAKKIEAKCVELVNAQAEAALAKVTAEIIDQPMTASFGDKKPVTMREFIGLYGREYLTEKVDTEGMPSSGGYGSRSMARIEYLTNKLLDGKFRQDIEKASHAAVAAVQAEMRAKHKAILETEVARFRAALAGVK